MILPNDNEVDNKLYYHPHQINTAEIYLDHYYSDSKVKKMVIWINNHDQRHVLSLNIIEEDPDYDKYQGTLGFTPKYPVKDTFMTITQLESDFLCIPLWRHFRYRFPQPT